MKRPYRYVAVDAAGRRVRGVLPAESSEEVRIALFGKGLVVTEAVPAESREIASAWRQWFEKRLTTTDLVLFTEQFRTLYTAGIALPEIFSILHNQVSLPSFKAVVSDMHRRILEGESLDQVFRAHPRVFSGLYCAMIRAGQSSGALPDVLERLVGILQHEEKTRQQIASATRYPKMVAAAMLGAFLILLNLVIPQFASVYGKAGVELPLPTRLAIELNQLCLSYWWVLVAVVLGLAAFWKSFVRTDKGLLWRDTAALKIPVLGAVVRKASIARFAAIFAILQRSGISVLESMLIVRDTVDNAFFQIRFGQIREALQAGKGIGEAMAQVKGFTPLAVSLVTIGEKAGNLEAMLDQLARHYDNEVKLAVEAMTEWIGPLLIVCLAVVVLFFALAIFLPMWDLVNFVQ